MNKIKSNPYKTILTISLGFLFVYLIWKHQWALLTSIIISFISLTSLTIAKHIENAWFKIAVILSYILPNVILTLVFYLFLFPISLISKVFNKSSNLLLNHSSNTSYKLVNKKYTKKDFITPF